MSHAKGIVTTALPRTARQAPGAATLHLAQARLGPCIVLADPDAGRRRLVRYALEGAGHDVVEAASENDCLALLRARPVALLVLASAMFAPDAYPLAWLRRDPAARHLPVLALTGVGASERDCLAGGADAALPEDVPPRALVTRVGELLSDPAAGMPRILHAGPLEMDCTERLVFAGGKPRTVSPCEFRVLEFLMRHPNRVLKREEILEAAWDRDAMPKARAVDVYIKRLRESLGPEFGALITTVRPVGYRLLLP